MNLQMHLYILGTYMFIRSEQMIISNGTSNGSTRVHHMKTSIHLCRSQFDKLNWLRHFDVCMLTLLVHLDKEKKEFISLKSFDLIILETQYSNLSMRFRPILDNFIDVFFIIELQAQPIQFSGTVRIILLVYSDTEFLLLIDRALGKLNLHRF